MLPARRLAFFAGASFTGAYDTETKTARPKSVGPHHVTRDQEDPADRGKDWSFVIDMLGGDALACADQCNKFQWAVDRSALDCAWQPISGAGGAKRFTFTAKVPTDTKTSPAMCLYVKPALNPTAPPRIAIGQIGVAQRPTP